jgi:hypothetical protein
MIDVLVLLLAFTMVLGPAFIGHFYGVKKPDVDGLGHWGRDGDPVLRSRTLRHAEGQRGRRTPDHG